MSDNLPAVRTETPAPVLVPRDVDSWAEKLPAIVDLARSICSTDFVPESMRDNVATVAAAILYGREINLPPMTSLSNVNVIKGRPGLSAVIMRAQVLAAGHEIRQDESTGGICTLSGRRLGTDYWQTVSYTIDDARQAGHLRNEQYVKNPRRMLRARATSELCELMFADVVRGMASLEELVDLDDGTPAGAPAPAKAGRVQRKARGSGTGDAAAPSPMPPVPVDESPPPMPPLPGEPGYGGPTGSAADVAGQDESPDARGTVPVAAPEPDGSPQAAVDAGAAGVVTPPPAAPASPDPVPDAEAVMITPAQTKKLAVTMKAAGITDRQEALDYVMSVVGRDVTSRNELSKAEASDVIDALDKVIRADAAPAITATDDAIAADAARTAAEWTAGGAL